MIEYIPEMVSSGIDSFKIEGRMKTALYVATVARTYRLAIDDFLEDAVFDFAGFSVQHHKTRFIARWSRFLGYQLLGKFEFEFR